MIYSIQSSRIETAKRHMFLKDRPPYKIRNARLAPLNEQSIKSIKMNILVGFSIYKSEYNFKTMYQTNTSYKCCSIC